MSYIHGPLKNSFLILNIFIIIARGGFRGSGEHMPPPPPLTFTHMNFFTIPDKKRIASLLYCFKNELFRKLVHWRKHFEDWPCVSRKIQEQTYRKGKRSLSHIKTLIQHVFILFYFRELLMLFEVIVQIWDGGLCLDFKVRGPVKLSSSEKRFWECL